MNTVSEFSGDISGSRPILVDGAGTVIYSTAKSYTGGTTVTGGTLKLGVTNALSSSGSVAIDGGTLDIQTFDQTLGTVSLKSGSIAGTGTITSNSTFDFQSGTVNANLLGTVGLNKTTDGTVTLKGSDAISGFGTTVSGGKLVVDGTLQSNVTVSGGSLGGIGTITGPVTLNSGVLSPGNSPGNLTVGGLIVNGGSYNWQLYDANGAAGVGYDTVTINGDLNLNGISGETPFTINLWSLSGISPDVNGDAINFMSATNSYQWTLATTTGEGQVIGFDSASDNIFINTNAVLGTNGTSGFTNNLNGGYFSVTADTNNVYLNFTHAEPVPEPSTILAIGFAGLGVVGAVRRRVRKSAGEVLTAAA